MPTVQVNNRCDKCIKLELDDRLVASSLLGGYKTQATEGQQLEFDFNHGGPSSTFKPKTSISDSFPDLPFITKSSEDGCDFCAFLKNLLQAEEVSYLLDDMLAGYGQVGRLPVRLKFLYQWETCRVSGVQGEDEEATCLGLKYFIVIASFDPQEHVLDGFRLSGGFQLRIKCKIHSAQSQGTLCVSARAWCIADVPEDRIDPVRAWLRLQNSSVSHLSAKSLAWIKNELRNCAHGIDSHTADCTIRGSSRFVPTRLIDVRNKEIRLIEKEEVVQQHSSPTTDYAALSYCWGNEPVSKPDYSTTTRNLETRKSGFPLGALPPVLQDAVFMTRALSLPYLWIDSICILQDSVDDWDYESSNMDKIYSSAYVTVASLTSSCHNGFLQPKRPRATMKFQSRLDPTATGNITMVFAECQGVGSTWNSRSALIPASRWFSRGWAYQESVLSTRILLMGTNFAAINCAEKFIEENKPPKAPHFQNIQRLVSEASGLETQWIKTATAYLNRHLTFPQDALPAISGVARLFSQRLGNEYLAGVWRTDIPRGILWAYRPYVNPRSQDLISLLHTLHSPTHYIAPSWSWVGHQFIHFRLMHYREDRLESECTATGSTSIQGQNKFGRVSEGFLLIKGHCCQIGPRTTTLKQSSGVRRYICLETNVDIMCTMDFAARGKILEGTYVLVLVASVPSNSSSTPSDDAQNPTFTRQAHGLVLHAKEGSDDFLRVGVFESCSHTDEALDFFHQLAIKTVRIV